MLSFLFDGQMIIGTTMITAAVMFHVAALVFLATTLSRVASKFAGNYPQMRTMLLLALSVLFIIGIHR